MAKVSFFIDGFNVYHSLKDEYDIINGINGRYKHYKYRKYLWLDFHTLSQRFTRKGDTLGDVFYFSALAFWKPDSVKRHKLFISALESRGINIILGKFKEKDRFCNNCKAYFKAHEEKQTDVNIGLYLLKEAFGNSYDTAIILTNDTDLIPAIKVVKGSFPHKKIGVLFPIGRWSSELNAASDFSRKIKKSDLLKSQFSDNVTLPSGVVLTRAPNWK